MLIHLKKHPIAIIFIQIEHVKHHKLVYWGLTSHQQLRSYGDEPATPGLQGE